MNEIKAEQLPDSEIRRWLDAEVNHYSRNYAAAERLPRAVDETPEQTVLANIAPLNKALLELVFIADARAQCDQSESPLPDKRAWVAVAVAGLRRIKSGFETSRPFSDTFADEHIQEYDDMTELRLLPDDSDPASWGGMRYGRLVLDGEIKLQD